MSVFDDLDTTKNEVRDISEKIRSVISNLETINEDSEPTEMYEYIENALSILSAIDADIY